jgi:hypothetical protein
MSTQTETYNTQQYHVWLEKVLNTKKNSEYRQIEPVNNNNEPEYFSSFSTYKHLDCHLSLT